MSEGWEQTGRRDRGGGRRRERRGTQKAREKKSQMAFICHQDSTQAMEGLHIQAHLAHPALAPDAPGSPSPIYPLQGLCPCFHVPGSEPFIPSTFYPTLIPQGQLR